MFIKLARHQKPPPDSKDRRHDHGSIFLSIFAAVAMVGILGASVMTFMKGPLSTSIRLTKINTAENQMSIGSQVAVMATASQTHNGDCDMDSFVEPLPWRTANASDPHPTGGGLVPLSLGINKKDPWGTEYGYCVWNHGAVTTGGGCDTNMLQGDNSHAHAVVSLISAGPDKTFTTTCRDFATADADSSGMLDDDELPLISKNTETDDDIITTFTYEEATGASGGLWSLKSADPGTAVISKAIETSGVANLKGGVMLPDKTLIDCADILNAGVMAKSGTGIEICDGTGNWSKVGGGASAALSTTASCTGTSEAGNVRYNAVSSLPEFCDGTMWRPFTLASNVATLVITPTTQNAMNVDGTVNLDLINCSNTGSFYCGAGTSFTVQNQGGATSATLGVSLTNMTNFVKTADTCHGHTIPALGSCTIVIKPKANGNTTYTGNLQISGNNNPFAVMQGQSTGFGCSAGRLGGGGIYAACGISDPDGTYNLVLIPSGCDGSVVNPPCPGGNDTNVISRPFGGAGIVFPNVVEETGAWGARQHQNLMAYHDMTSTVLPAVQYCNDMVYQGFSDWFLPSRTEWDYVQAAFNLGRIPFVYGAYKLTDLTEYYGYGNRTQEWVSQAGAPYYRGADRSSSQLVRCVRRDNLPLPTALPDIDPDNVALAPAIVFSSGAVGTSNTVTLTGIMQPVTATITGGTGMNIIKNGVATNSTSVSNLKLNDTLAFRMNGSATIGAKNAATVTIGTDSYTWWVGYGDQSRSVKIFVSSAVYSSGGLGGLSGADAKCNALAAASPLGLSASWKALISDKSVNAADRIPWSWGTMVNIDGTTVVDGGMADLFDGTLDNAVLVDEKGAQRSDTVWTGSFTSGGTDNSTSNCNNFSSSISEYAFAGYANSATSTWIASGSMHCNDPRRIYCVENISGAVDTTPNDITLDYKIQVAASSRQASAPFVISGMSTGATQTLTVSATAGTPTFKINGGAEVTSGTIRNGDSVVFLLTAPATFNSNNMMTITAGTMSTRWRVWTGATNLVFPILSRVKRVFVTSNDVQGPGFGGVTGADTACQAAANTNILLLGTTWKAIISGIAESEWAINRVGYNWTELQLIDGTVVAYAGGLWSTLISPIVKTQSGVTRAATRVHSGTAANGKSYSSVPDLSNMFNWTNGTCSATYYQGNSSALTAGISQSYWLCQYDAALYCIEQ